MRALVVDDSRAIRRIVGAMLRELGFEIFEAGEGAEALKVLKERGPIDLAMVDWNMPGMTGIDFLKAVRSERAYDPLRVVLVTTETGLAEVRQALAAGANEYIMKPFTKEVVTEKLDLLGMGGS